MYYSHHCNYNTPSFIFGIDHINNNPDFIKYAESYGAHGHSITSITGFIETVDRAYREGGVHLIDLPIDYSQNVKDLITDLSAHKSIV